MRAVHLTVLFVHFGRCQESLILRFSFGRRLGLFFESPEHFDVALELLHSPLQRAEAPVAQVVAVFPLLLDEDSEAVRVEAFVDDLFDKVLLLLLDFHTICSL